VSKEEMKLTSQLFWHWKPVLFEVEFNTEVKGPKIFGKSKSLCPLCFCAKLKLQHNDIQLRMFCHFEEQIKQIIRLCSDGRPVNTITLSTRAHFMWRNMLISDPNKNSQFLGDSKNGSVINMSGKTRVTVFECLRDSSLVWFIHSCSCRESTETFQKSAYAGILAKDLWKIAVGKYKKKCNKCREQINSHHLPYVATTTGFIHFSVTPSPDNFIDFRETMVLLELITMNEITFEFGYIGYAEGWVLTELHIVRNFLFSFSSNKKTNN
jgi:hypothetical protein